MDRASDISYKNVSDAKLLIKPKNTVFHFLQMTCQKV